MITLNFDVNDQTLTRQDENTVAANSRLVHLCEFSFSSEWDGRGKVATFKKRDLMLSVILDDDACTIPPEILQSENKIDVFELSVCGADGNSTITSTIVRVPILAGTWDPFTEEITPTLFEQIMQKIDEIEKGEVSPELVYEAVSEYMEAHPLEPIIAEDVAAYFEEHKSEFKGDKGNTGATPNVTATAEVGATVGTPSVSVTKTGTAENPALHFNFQNLKGVKGDTGATPVITANASVDGTTGTPAVSVTKTGTAENPNIDFAFTGLKGEKGDKGDTYDDTEIKAEIDDIWKVQGELGTKNLLVYPYPIPSGGYGGMQFTAQSDGSCLINGTATAYSHFNPYTLTASGSAWEYFNLHSGKYIMSLGIDNIEKITSGYVGFLVRFNDKRVSPSVVTDYTIKSNYVVKSQTFEITQEMVDALNSEDIILEIRIFTASDSTVDNLTVYPMLRYASDADDTWQPYAPTNYELMQSDNTLAEGIAKFGKRLWQGNFTSGSIEVAGAAKYSAFIFNLNGAYALGTSTSGGGSFGMASSYNIAQVGYRVTPQTSGDNIIFSIDSTSYGGMMDGAQRAITEIYGLF